MPHFFKNCDLSVDALEVRMVLDLLFLEDFDCNLS